MVIEAPVSEAWKVLPKDGAAENDMGKTIEGELLRSSRSLVFDNTFHSTLLESRRTGFQTRLFRIMLFDIGLLH